VSKFYGHARSDEIQNRPELAKDLSSASRLIHGFMRMQNGLTG
jgi:hypothetical protein